MYALNDNNQSKKCQRFMDLSNEPLTAMTPIRGYDKMPLVSLEQAVKPLIQYIPEIDHMVDVAKKRCKKPPPDGLSEDQSAAIMLYTMEWEPKGESVYYRLNKDLRTEDRQVLRPWFLYLKLLFTALSLLPSKSCTVYRGVKNDLANRYKKGEKIVWWGFSSCTSTMDVLRNESFMGPSGKRTMFTIECQSGKEIRQHSYFKTEDEILLPAAREFQIKSVFPQADGLCLIQLKEVQPKYPLLESSSTISQIVQTFPLSQFNPVEIKTSVQSTSYKPISQQPMQTSYNQPYYIEMDQPTEQDETNSTGSKNESSNDDCGCCLMLCCLIYCCPCTVCYLYCKD